MLMAAVGDLDDRFARVGIIMLRHNRALIGELLDLELEGLRRLRGERPMAARPAGKAQQRALCSRR